MARPKRTIADLRASSNHFIYEIWMLESVAKGLASGIAGQGPLKNALIESFVIHVRAVMDFLYAENAKPDDVIAEDYFDQPEEWTKTRLPLSDLLSNAKRRAGKEVAHLTYARLLVTQEAKPWEFTRIFSELTVVYNDFFVRVAKDRLGSEWERTIQELSLAVGQAKVKG